MRRRSWARFSRWVVESPGLTWCLAVVLLGSAVLGYIYWYGPFAVTAPWYLWIFVPDSPVSATLMAAALIAFHYGRRWELLGLAAGATCIKYGLWTDFVWVMTARSGGGYGFVAALMSVTHLGMAILGLLVVAMLSRFRPVWLLLVSLFLVANDVVDYGYGYYPPLPDPQDLAAISRFAVGMTGLIVCCGVILAWRSRRRAAATNQRAVGLPR